MPDDPLVAKLGSKMHREAAGQVVKSITDGLNEIKDAHLGLTGCGIGAPPHFKHLTVLKRLCAAPATIDGAALADAFLARIDQNWRAGHGQHRTLPSRENWRFTRAGKMTQRNSSPEVAFERDLARVSGERWANQVPTASGLLGAHLDKRRAIDLVEKRGPGEFELIELKIDSDTPLYAAMEVLDYGAIYASSRLHADALGYQPGLSDLLEARRIRLRVLGPRAFYEFKTRQGRRPFQLDWLERTIGLATGRLAERIGGGVEMDFGFDVFPDDFVWEPGDPCRSDGIVEIMEGRRRWRCAAAAR